MDSLNLREIKEVLREWKNSEIDEADLVLEEEIRGLYESVSLRITANEEIKYFNQKLKNEFGENTKATIGYSITQGFEVGGPYCFARYSFDIPNQAILRDFSTAEDSYNALCLMLEILGVKGEKYGN